MQVRILKETPYEPQKGDSPRCVGQLRKRADRVEYRFTPQGGVETIEHKAGPMQHYFPVGSTPVVSDEFGMQLVTSGAAEIVDGPEVIQKTAAEILDGMVQPQ